MKKALILGGNGAIGAETAKRLINSGWTAYCSARKENESVDGDINRNVNIFSRFLDVADKASVDDFCSWIGKAEEFDLFVDAIANKLTFDRFTSIKQDIFEEDMRINCIGKIPIYQKALSMMEKGGCIVVILSEMVTSGNPAYQSSYGISKYAQLGLMNALSSEIGEKGPRICGISPGMMDTKLIVNLPDTVKKMYLYERKAKHFVSPGRVASKIIELYNDPGSNGKNLEVKPI